MHTTKKGPSTGRKAPAARPDRSSRIKQQSSAGHYQALKDKYERMLESISDGFFALDREWHFSYINDHALRIWKKTREDLIGRSLWDVVPSAVNTIFHEKYHEAASRRVPVSFEAISPLLKIWVEVRVFPERDGLSVYFHDITERREAETQRDAISTLLRLHTESSSRREYLERVVELFREWSGCRNAGIRVLDESGRIPYAAAAGFDSGFLHAEGPLSLEKDLCVCTRVIGRAPEVQDLPSLTDHGSFYENDLPRFLAGMAEGPRGRFRSACAGCGFTSIAVIPLRRREKIVGAVHLADTRTDMVPRRTIEFLERMGQLVGEAIIRFDMEEERSRLASAVDGSADGVVITDPAGSIQYVNPAFSGITGFEKKDVLGRTINILDGRAGNGGFPEEVRSALERDKVWRSAASRRRKDGTHYYEDSTWSVVRDRAGTAINYVLLMRDITEKRRLESIADAVNTMNNIGYIFSGVRHEIGNPVNTINMIVGILQEKQESLPAEAIRDHLRSIVTQVERVEYLLRSLKSFNMYETSAPEPVAVGSLLASFLPLVTADLSKRGVALDVDLSPDAGAVIADTRALQQVLLNLVTNAMDALNGKDDPRIAIRVFRADGRISIVVQDNGCGIRQEDLGNLFKPFYTTKQQGTGLGLVIVKRMVSNMNGTIGVTSRRGEGTSVEISLAEGNR